MHKGGEKSGGEGRQPKAGTTPAMGRGWRLHCDNGGRVWRHRLRLLWDSAVSKEKETRRSRKEEGASGNGVWDGWVAKVKEMRKRVDEEEARDWKEEEGWTMTKETTKKEGEQEEQDVGEEDEGNGLVYGKEGKRTL